MTPAEDDALERRSRATLKARARKVTLGQCGCCGVTLPASTAAEIKRGEAQCPTAVRIREVFREATTELFIDELVAALRGEAS